MSLVKWLFNNCIQSYAVELTVWLSLFVPLPIYLAPAATGPHRRWKFCTKLKAIKPQTIRQIFTMWDALLVQWDFTVGMITLLRENKQPTKCLVSWYDAAVKNRNWNSRENLIIYSSSCRSRPIWLSFFHTMKVHGDQELWSSTRDVL